jgi:hypothetical protein
LFLVKSSFSESLKEVDLRVEVFLNLLWFLCGEERSAEEARSISWDLLMLFTLTLFKRLALDETAEVLVLFM